MPLRILSTLFLTHLYSLSPLFIASIVNSNFLLPTVHIHHALFSYGTLSLSLSPMPYALLFLYTPSLIRYLLGQLIQHQILVLLLPPDVVRQPRICIVDAHRASEVPLGVLDALELVDTQLQDPLAHLTHPQLGRDHWHLWPVAPDRWRGVWWSKHIRIVFSNVGGVVAR